MAGWALRIRRAVDRRDMYHGQTEWPGPQGSRDMAACKGNAEPESHDPELGRPGGEGQLCLGGDIWTVLISQNVPPARGQGSRGTEEDQLAIRCPGSS